MLLIPDRSLSGYCMFSMLKSYLTQTPSNLYNNECCAEVAQPVEQ